MPLRTIIIKATRSGTASTVIIRRGASGTGGGDHGTLTGLGDDDHTQYLNNARGDARYAKLTGATFTGPITAQSITGDGGALIVESSLDIQGNVTIPNGDLRLDDPTGAGITCNGPIIADSLALLTTPLPITSGGTNASSAGAARTVLGLGSEQSPTFAGLTVASGTISSPSFVSASTLVLSAGGSNQNIDLLPSGTGVVNTGGANGWPILFSGGLQFRGRERIISHGNGLMSLTDNTSLSFDRLALGGTTPSFPAIKRNGTAINIVLANNGGDAPLTCSNLSASGSIILPTSTTPSSAGAAGVAGTIVRDANYLYVCTATNTWTRIALAW